MSRINSIISFSEVNQSSYREALDDVNDDDEEESYQLSLQILSNSSLRSPFQSQFQEFASPFRFSFSFSFLVLLIPFAACFFIWLIHIASLFTWFSFSPSFVGASFCSKAPNVRDSATISQCFGLIRGWGKAFHASAINRFRMPCGFQFRCHSSLSSVVQRNPSFSRLNSDDIDFFRSVLGEKNVVQDEDRLLDANTDWLRKYRGSSKLLLQPRSTEEVKFFFSELWLLVFCSYNQCLV